MPFLGHIVFFLPVYVPGALYSLMLTSIKISTAVNILFYAVMLTNNESVFWNQHLQTKKYSFPT